MAKEEGAKTTAQPFREGENQEGKVSRIPKPAGRSGYGYQGCRAEKLKAQKQDRTHKRGKFDIT